MENSLAFATARRNSTWHDTHSMSSDEARDAMLSQSPSLTEPRWIVPSLSSQLQTGQISPSIDMSSAPTMIHSAASSCADSWSNGGVEAEDVEMDNNWEQGSDDVLTVPKLEPVEDDINLDDLKAAPPPTLPSEANSTDSKPKRPRGRPRKHPLTPVANVSKVTKGRSKTGCITCRKRKKKCDEAKPRCMNCEKNAVVCEGYHEKQIWKSGRERAEEERLRKETLPVITMQPIFHGVETAEDKIFWKHYITNLSNVLTVEGESKNAFKDILLNLANKHQGLMHSILALSNKHIDWDAPYGIKLLANNPLSTRESLQQRADYHHDEAMKRLYEDMDRSVDKDDPEYKTILSARYGQMLCLLLQTLADGNPRGEHRVHLQAYQTLIQHSPPEDGAFYSFITEFFQYCIYADDLFWHPETMTNRLSSEEWEPLPSIYPPKLLGVTDGLFKYLSQITTIRNTIRDNMAASADPLVDYTSLYQAAEIDAAIKEWTPQWPQGDSRDRVGLLYKQMMWVYLFRTIYPPSASSMRRSTFSTAPLAAPPIPHRRASMMATSTMARPPNAVISHCNANSLPSSRHPSRTNSMHEQVSTSSHEAQPERASSPPPSRLPAYHDRRITLAVEESLTILEAIKPSDPCQTLLLIPCLIIGTACFETSQRERIRGAIQAVGGYTGLRNFERVIQVLEEVWACMEQGDWVSVWDWQGVARRMGLDFPCA